MTCKGFELDNSGDLFQTLIVGRVFLNESAVCSDLLSDHTVV